ncbi:MAG: rubrerythrin family protein [Cyanobacteria bacterium]|nr:rubrerythrin family protein [Cyanobacteriota bacterium]
MVKEKTLQNLKDAFAGESQANRRYLAFAKKADEEGYKQAAKLFRAAAEAETIHAHNHLAAMGEIKSTRENIEAAINGETFEFTKMYPEMIKQSDADGEKDAKRSFNFANKVEEIHAKLFKNASENLSNSEDEEIHVCPVCGNTFVGKTPEKCPICGADKAKFILVK